MSSILPLNISKYLMMKNVIKLELATFPIVSGRSNQLNYAPAFILFFRRAIHYVKYFDFFIEVVSLFPQYLDEQPFGLGAQTDPTCRDILTN